MLKYTQQGKTI